MNIKERFFQHVNKTSTCWLWTGQLSKDGYGIINIKKLKSGRLAHRISWKLHNNDLEKDICVLHKCDIRKCVNPDHLFLGSRFDNTIDMISKNRGNQVKGEDVGGAKLTSEQVLEIRKSNEKHKILAEKYGVTHYTISSIKTNRSWKWLSGDASAGTHYPTGLDYII